MNGYMFLFQLNMMVAHMFESHNWLKKKVLFI
jgi:hypothetical protein